MKKFRKYPLRNIRIKMWWIVDDALHGATNGDKLDYDIWINLKDEPDIIKWTIAHELAHIHLFRYHRKEHGDKIFYKHNKLHRDTEDYYMKHWSKEIDKLYKKLLKADIDIESCNVKQLRKVVKNYERCKKYSQIFG